MQPTIFIGHGSPMNAIATNEYTRALSALGKRIAKPKAILCISAHWMTHGSWVTNMVQPRTIHDFYGFPDALFAVEYPAPGNPQLAERVAALISGRSVQYDDAKWGLDHGTWSVLCHLYPNADVPTVQLSIDIKEPFSVHYQLGQALRPLRDEGILILGSGNIVHNLQRIRWEEGAQPYAWATEFDAWVENQLVTRDDVTLVEHATDSTSGQLSIPTVDHYLPFLYILGASHPQERARTEYASIQNGSISMRCVSFGA